MLPIERHLRLSHSSPDELRARALEYRKAVACTRCTQTREAFRRLADRFERLAQERDREITTLPGSHSND